MLSQGCFFHISLLHAHIIAVLDAVSKMLAVIMVIECDSVTVFDILACDLA